MRGLSVTMKESKPKFRRRVTEWFKKNARDLPWRRTIDPYAILVSEIMCQQTQVVTVLPYFERWMRRFPGWAALAAATEHEVMGLWQGLGYYSRARNLHAAAKVVAEAGEFPGDLEGIRRLPGVGRYTAGAVAAFAFDMPAALVDANIARVLARVFGLREAIDGAGLGRVWEIAEELQTGKGRAFNGGLMELGALVCTPRGPRCEVCPVADYCEARALGMEEEIPVKKARRKIEKMTERCALMVRDGSILLEHQRGKRWRGLWKLPALEAIPEEVPVAVVEYPFTHHRVTLSVYKREAPGALKEGWEWHPIQGLNEVPIAAGHRKVMPFASRTQKGSKSSGSASGSETTNR